MSNESNPGSSDQASQAWEAEWQRERDKKAALAYIDRQREKRDNVYNTPEQREHYEEKIKSSSRDYKREYGERVPSEGCSIM